MKKIAVSKVDFCESKSVSSGVSTVPLPINRVRGLINLSDWQRTLISIFVTALLIRGIFILTIQDGFYFPDSLHYSKAAVNLIANGEFGESYNRPPVYPLFLAGTYVLFGQTILAIRIVQALMGAFLAIVIAFIARRIGGAAVGALAGILWGVYPLGVFISGLIYPTSVATILLACALLCMVTKADQGLGPGRVVLSGIIFGLAALTKPVVLVTVIATTLWVMYWSFTRRLFLATLFLLGVSIPLAPWTVRNFYVYNRIVIVSPQLVEHLPSMGATSTDGTDKEGKSKVEAIFRHPGQFIIHFTREFAQFWTLYPQHITMNTPGYREKTHEQDSRIVRKTIFGTKWTDLISVLSVVPMFFFALIGACVMWVHKERRRDLSLLIILILSFAIGYSFFWAQMRYRIPIEPYIIILSANGLYQMWAMLLQAAPEHFLITSSFRRFAKQVKKARYFAARI